MSLGGNSLNPKFPHAAVCTHTFRLHVPYQDCVRSQNTSHFSSNVLVGWGLKYKTLITVGVKNLLSIPFSETDSAQMEEIESIKIRIWLTHQRQLWEYTHICTHPHTHAPKHVRIHTYTHVHRTYNYGNIKPGFSVHYRLSVSPLCSSANSHTPHHFQGESHILFQYTLCFPPPAIKMSVA